MLLKTISMPTEQASFSLKAGKTFIPMKAIPAYLLSPETIRYYEQHRWGRGCLDDIRLTKRIYLEQGKNLDPLHYLKQGEGFMSVFLPHNAENARLKPFGMNWIESHMHGENKHLYVAEIENFQKGTHKGIGRATIAQAITYYRSLYPDAHNTDTALKLIPENSDEALRTLYRDYGFVLLDDNTMYMTLESAMIFMNDYTERLLTAFGGIPR